MNAQFNENIFTCWVLRQYYQRALVSSLLLLDETAIDLQLDFATLDQVIVDTFILFEVERETVYLREFIGNEYKTKTFLKEKRKYFVDIT